MALSLRRRQPWGGHGATPERACREKGYAGDSAPVVSQAVAASLGMDWLTASAARYGERSTIPAAPGPYWAPKTKCHRSSPPRVRSADTRRNSSNLPRRPRARNSERGTSGRWPAESERGTSGHRPAEEARAAPPTRGLNRGAGLRSGPGGRAQVRGAEVTDPLVTVGSGGPAQHLSGHVGDAPA